MIFKKVTLLYVNINKEKFKKKKEGSCITKIHPCFDKLPKDKQEKVRQLINEVVDIIREHVEVEDL